MADAVLDASAILAVVFEEPGAEMIDAVLPGAAVSAVNIAEAASKFSDHGMPPETVQAIIEGLQLEVYPVDLAQAYENGRLRERTKNAGLSLGDRSCLALAVHLKLPAMTTDRIWAEIADATKVDIKIIR